MSSIQLTSARFKSSTNNLAHCLSAISSRTCIRKTSSFTRIYSGKNMWMIFCLHHIQMPNQQFTAQLVSTNKKKQLCVEVFLSLTFYYHIFKTVLILEDGIATAPNLIPWWIKVIMIQFTQPMAVVQHILETHCFTHYQIGHIWTKCDIQTCTCISLVSIVGFLY